MRTILGLQEGTSVWNLALPEVDKREVVLRLPGHSDWSVLKHTNSRPEFTGMPVVLVTILALVPQPGEGEIGAVDYLVKGLSAAGWKEAATCIPRWDRGY